MVASLVLMYYSDAHHCITKMAGKHHTHVHFLLRTGENKKYFN